MLVALLVALGGLGAGHVAEYLLLAPDAHERRHLLVRSGHGYLPSALAAATFLAFLGLAVVFVTSVRRGLSRGQQRSPRPWSHALPAAQVLAFVALEVGERLAAHASLADLGTVLALGLPIGAIVGFFAGRLVALLERAGERIAEFVASRRRRRPTRPGSLRPVSWFLPPRSRLAAPRPARGPPAVLVLT